MDVAGALGALAGDDGDGRLAALRWLGERAPGALRPDHAALLGDPDLAVRALAVVVLRAAPDPELVDAARRGLRELVVSPVAAERYAGLRAAATLANPTIAPRLFPFLADPDPTTRRLALLALAAVPPGLLGPALLRDHALAALADPDDGVRDAARALYDGYKFQVAGSRLGRENVQPGTCNLQP